MKPSFWTDVRMASLPIGVRLFYIGLWMQADDAGWFRWDVPQIGAELFSFESRSRREKSIAVWGDMLEAEGRIVRHECGHAFIPRFTDHQRFAAGGRQVHTVETEHRGCSGNVRGGPGLSEVPRTVSKGKGSGTSGEPERLVSERLGAPARAPSGAAGAVDWTEKVERIRDRGLVS